jgi:hypothetical protein
MTIPAQIIREFGAPPAALKTPRTQYCYQISSWFRNTYDG